MHNSLMNGNQARDVVKSAMPPRSRLYSLKPEGLGTPYTESLTSYITRLAEAHGVFTGTLINQELAPMLGRADLTARGFSQVAWDAGTINSSGVVATDWVGVLEALTLRSDLRYLTLLTWQDILTPIGLVRSTKAWCSACFEEWRAVGQIVYEPLLWTLQVVTVCPRHHRKLQQRCPHVGCNRLLPWLARRAQPGYCSFCEKWLGILVGGDLEEDEQLDEEVITQQDWVAENVGELIAMASVVLSPPRKQKIARGIAHCIEQVSQGKIPAFARMLKIPEHFLWHWWYGSNIPTLLNLLKLSYSLGISLRSFLLDEEERLVLDLNTFRPWPLWNQQPNNGRHLFQLNIIQSTLEAALGQEPPPSLRKITKQLGYSGKGVFYAHFPDLAYAISARYLAHRQREHERKIAQIREQIRQKALELHMVGVYPSTNHIAKLGVKLGYFHHPEINAAWHEVLHALGYEK